MNSRINKNNTIKQKQNKMKKLFTTLVCVALGMIATRVEGQQVGVNTNTPDSSAAFEVMQSSTNAKGVVFPRMTQAERSTITNPATGLIIYNTSMSCLQINDGTPASPIWNCISGIAGIKPGEIATLNCASATHAGTLTIYTAAAGVTSTVPYTGGDGGPYGSYAIPSTGVLGLTANLTGSSFVNGSGNLVYTITGTPTSNGTASFALNIGGQSCTLTRTVNAHPSSNGTAIVSAYGGPGCTGNGIITGILKQNEAASGQTMTIYANVTTVGTYNISATNSGFTFSGSGTFTSTGCQLITLTASGTPTTCTSGSGSVPFTTNTTPSVTANACAIVCATPPTYVQITALYGGKKWLDRNLGATNRSDVNIALARGYLFQWGRPDDGHAYRSSGTTTTLATSNTPTTSCFILNNGDWKSTVDNNLWQGVSGVNNPCPAGYRLPTQAEILASGNNFNVCQSYQANNYFNAYGCERNGTTGVIAGGGAGLYSYVWTSESVSNTNARAVQFGDGGGGFCGYILNWGSYSIIKTTGCNVRCVLN